VPTDIYKTVGHEVKFNNPIGLRKYVRPIGVKVVSKKGKVDDIYEEFFVGSYNRTSH